MPYAKKPFSDPLRIPFEKSQWCKLHLKASASASTRSRTQLHGCNGDADVLFWLTLWKLNMTCLRTWPHVEAHCHIYELVQFFSSVDRTQANGFLRKRPGMSLEWAEPIIFTSCLWDLTVWSCPASKYWMPNPNDKATNEDEDVDMEVEVDGPFLDVHQYPSMKIRWRMIRISSNHIHFWQFLVSFGLVMPWSYCAARLLGSSFMTRWEFWKSPSCQAQLNRNPRPSNPLPRQHKMLCHPLRCHVWCTSPLDWWNKCGCVSKIRGPNKPISGNFCASWILRHTLLEFHKFLTVRPPFWPKRSLWQRQVASRMWRAGSKTWALSSFHSLWRFVCWELVVKTVLTDPTTQAELVC